MDNAVWHVVTGFLGGIAVSLWLVRTALTDAIRGMSEDKAMDRAEQILKEMRERLP